MSAVAAKPRTKPARPKPATPAKASTPASLMHQELPVVPDRQHVASALLTWYANASRDLPWRVPPGTISHNLDDLNAPGRPLTEGGVCHACGAAHMERAQPKPLADPYKVWLSEVMLQQTTVKVVVPYFNKFIRRWPTVEALAAASLDDVLAAWAGLGYYSRARNVHKCAQEVVSRLGGQFPAQESALLELPGIGAYTAAAISAIAFGIKATPVDGNIERVMSRVFAVEQPLPGSKPALRRLAQTLTPDYRSGDYAQALMDLGATVCTPRRPSCMICPLTAWCKAHAVGTQDILPFRQPKGARPTRRGVAFLALREDGHILLRQRPEEGLLARMMEVPTTEWSEQWRNVEEALRTAPVRADWWAVPGTVVHTFTHFKLELLVYRTVVAADVHLTLWATPDRCRWVERRKLRAQALPSLFRKVIAHATGE